ncbi:MAG: hypothetical protein ACTHK2_04545 [Dokdonella sp.]|uniref:hypothetical protein n=1 Tax=Dokdonella sp. TaxID=2291710 RepID=UPI003F7F411C
MSTNRLATDEDMRAITSRELDAIDRLPHLYIPTDSGELMRGWGVAHERTLADELRLHPGALVAPANLGQWVERGDLVYHGAKPAEAFLPDKEKPGTRPG